MVLLQPGGPGHWFYQEWVQKAGERNAFTSTSPWRTTRACLPRCGSDTGPCSRGTFYRRFVLGEWTAAAGLVYDFFSREMVCEPPEGRAAEWYISCDYGTVNPTSMGLWGRWGRCGTGWRSSITTPAGGAAEDGQRIRRRAGGTGGRAAHQGGGGRPLRRQLSGVPAAAGLAGAAGGERGALRHPHHGGAAADGPAGHLSRVRRRHPGVRAVPLGHQRRRADQVCKEHDHAMDDIRYFAVTVAAKERGGSWAGSVERRIF